MGSKVNKLSKIHSLLKPSYVKRLWAFSVNVYTDLDLSELFSYVPPVRMKNSKRNMRYILSHAPLLIWIRIHRRYVKLNLQNIELRTIHFTLDLDGINVGDLVVFTSMIRILKYDKDHCLKKIVSFVQRDKNYSLYNWCMIRTQDPQFAN